MANENFFPWNDIPDSNLFPSGVFRMKIDELEDGEASSSGNRMFRGRFNCVEPMEFAGMAHFENFVVGTEQNPKGINPGTMGARALKQVLNKAQVPPSNDIAALCASAKGAELLMSLVLNTPTKGDYKGIPQNRMVECYRLGDKPVGVVKEGAPGVMAGVSAPPPPPPAGIPGMPSMMQPLQPAPAYTPPTSVVYAPPMPPPVAPPMAPAPASMPQPIAQPVVPAAPAGPQMLCSICQQYVPVTQFGQHVQAHMQAGQPR